MNSRIKKGIAAAAAAVVASAALIVGNAGSSTATGPSMQAFGITGDGLTMASFKTNTPNVLDWVQDITGLPAGNFGIGIDIRVQNNTLYLVDNQGFIYTIAIPGSGSDPVVAVKVSQLTVPLYGTCFGVDFNPAADRLRIVSDNGQNLRHNLNDHTTIEDATLNATPAPVRGICAIAYTNNDLAPSTATTLFDINPVTDQVLIQSPPNNGNVVPTGSLTVDAAPKAGFDIWSDLASGTTIDNFGYASLTVGGAARFYDIELLTGKATLIGSFPRLVQITDVAVALDTM